MRKVGFVAAFALALSACAASSDPQDTGTDEAEAVAAEEVVIVIPFDVRDGVDEGDALEAMSTVRAFISDQPGLRYEGLMKGSTQNVDPEYVHVSRWASQADWDAMVGSEQFAAVMDPNSELISSDLAEVYTSVE